MHRKSLQRVMLMVFGQQGLLRVATQACQKPCQHKQHQPHLPEEMSPLGASLPTDPEFSQIWKPLHHSAHKSHELRTALPKHTKLMDEA